MTTMRQCRLPGRRCLLPAISTGGRLFKVCLLILNTALQSMICCGDSCGESGDRPHSSHKYKIDPVHTAPIYQIKYSQRLNHCSLFRKRASVFKQDTYCNYGATRWCCGRRRGLGGVCGKVVVPIMGGHVDKGVMLGVDHMSAVSRRDKRSAAPEISVYTMESACLGRWASNHG